MPLIQSSYKASVLFRNPHFSTIWASVLRKTVKINYERQCLELSDGDFIDLDWAFAKNEKGKKLAIVTHGLLGNSDRSYVKGCVLALNKAGYDACAWNHRGLSGRPNRLETMTTHGSTFEISAVITEAIKQLYTEIILVGWSKGGNINLKYLGENAENLPVQVKTAIAISAPLDLIGSVKAMGENTFYSKRFRQKLLTFLESRRHLIAANKFKQFETYKTLGDFTEKYVAPLNGFGNAKGYYYACAALPLLHKISIPTLIINALDDPILSLTCSPAKLAQSSKNLYLETPSHGGHCAFPLGVFGQSTWADKRIVEWIMNLN